VSKVANSLTGCEPVKSLMPGGAILPRMAPCLVKFSCVSIFKPIILPVVLCGCETWSLTLREERRLRVFENRVLR
jgi:hypothetical protein